MGDLGFGTDICSLGIYNMVDPAARTDLYVAADD
jgi:hypothetical protein